MGQKRYSIFVLLMLLSGLISAQNITEAQFNIAKDTLLKRINSDREISTFDFVGGGDLNSIAQNNGRSTAGNLSVGLYFLREFEEGTTKFLKDIEIDFAINISTTVDSFTTDNPRSFGNYILNPINSRQSARLDFYSLFHPIKKKNGKRGEHILTTILDGIFMRFYGSNANWIHTGQSSSVTAIHWKIGLFHEFLPDELSRKNNSSVMLGISRSLRAITGDIRGNTGELLSAITGGSSKSAYWGWDLVFGVKFNRIRAEFLVPFVNKEEDFSIKGLTDIQFATQVRFIGGFPLGLNRSTREEERIKDIKF